MPITKPSVADVRAIITSGLDDATITIYIDDATLLVQDCIGSLNADKQTAIVKYVAAHFIAVREAQGGSGVTTSSKLGDAQDSYAPVPLGQGLQGTLYGQQALMLDTTGCLADLGKRRSIARVL